LSLIRSDQSEDRVDAFVFVREVEPPRSFRQVVSQLLEDFPEQDDGPIVFASEMIGEFRAVIHLARPTLAGIQNFISEELWQAGVHSELAVEESVLTTMDGMEPMGPIRHSPKPPHLALLRISLTPGADPGGVLAEIGGVTEGIGGDLVVYASTVYGEFDLLVEVGAPADRLAAMLVSLRAIRALAREREDVERLTTSIGYVQT
jgi:hypothetical protein